MASHQPAHLARKRISNACQRCKLKKSRCNGCSPCERCRAANAICTYQKIRPDNHRVHSQTYVRLVESKHSLLVRGLQELYQRLVTGKGITGLYFGQPLSVNEILQRLGISDGPSYDSLESCPSPFHWCESAGTEDSSSHLHPGTFGQTAEEQSCLESSCSNTSSLFSDPFYQTQQSELSPVSLSSPTSPSPDSTAYFDPTIAHNTGVPVHSYDFPSIIPDFDMICSEIVDERNIQMKRLHIMSDHGSAIQPNNVLSPWAKYRIALNATEPMLCEP
ncbi:hypothetical protein BJX62DRAFT_248652 [Aspergillus germanicus]